MAAGDVISRYNELRRVERSCRMSKSDLQARPVLCDRNMGARSPSRFFGNETVEIDTASEPLSSS